MESRVIELEKKFRYYYNLVRKHDHILWDFYYGNYHLAKDNNYNTTTFWIHNYLQNMYNIACVYIETLGLHDFLKEFKLKYGKLINDKNKATSIESFPLLNDDTDDEMLLIHEWKNALSAFNLFETNKKKEELIKVIEVLNNTNEILKLTQTKVYKEDSINKTIRNFLDLYYGNVTAFSDGYFNHKFKNYRPDVILTDLGICIEYKLVKQEKEIAIKLDELIIDANQYTGNPRNKFCIAVFCLSEKLTVTKKQIKEGWKKRRFPNQWQLVIVSDIKIVRK